MTRMSHRIRMTIDFILLYHQRSDNDVSYRQKTYFFPSWPPSDHLWRPPPLNALRERERDPHFPWLTIQSWDFFHCLARRGPCTRPNRPTGWNRAALSVFGFWFCFFAIGLANLDRPRPSLASRCITSINIVFGSCEKDHGRFANASHDPIVYNPDPIGADRYRGIPTIRDPIDSPCRLWLTFANSTVHIIYWKARRWQRKFWIFCRLKFWNRIDENLFYYNIRLNIRQIHISQRHWTNNRFWKSPIRQTVRMYILSDAQIRLLLY